MMYEVIMNRAALYIVRQNFNSKCFKCKKEKKFFTVYRCGKCKPQTVEKYCYECCEASLIEKEGEDDDEYINALCMGCAFCYDYVQVSKFYKKEKKNGWQSLKYDCDKCVCCCGKSDCLTGSICCCIPDSDSDSEDDEEDDDDDEERKQKEEEEQQQQQKQRKQFNKKFIIKLQKFFQNKFDLNV